MSHKKWTAEEVNKIVRLRRGGYSWKDIQRNMGGSKENIRAVFRRFVGAKTSSYTEKEKAIERSELYHLHPDEMPKIAVLDIETLPMIKYAWQLFDNYSSIEEVIEDSCMLSWAGKLLNGEEIKSDILTPEEAITRNTERITKSVWEFLRGCDAVIGHNYVNFDSRYINTEFLKWGLNPLKYKIIDTFLIAKQNLRFSSNKMKFINDRLGIRNKLDHEGFPLWKRCSEGDPEALKDMLAYNEGDIGATEELFYKLRPYVKNVNIALYATHREAEMCPICGSVEWEIEKLDTTPAGLWEIVRCQSCGSLTRRKQNLLSTVKRKSLHVNY